MLQKSDRCREMRPVSLISSPVKLEAKDKATHQHASVNSFLKWREFSRRKFAD